MPKYTLDAYRRQANRLPFELELDDDRKIVIQPPDGDTILEVQSITDLRRQLQLLAGDQFDELMEVFGREQGSLLKPFMADLTKHFGLGE